MPTKIESFADYDAAKAAREQQEDTLTESKLELLLNQHPAVKELRTEAERMRKKAARSAGITLFGKFFQSSEFLLEQLNETEKDWMNRYREQLGRELRKTARKEAQREIIRQNINDLAACGVYLSQPRAGYLPLEHKEELYSRVAAELERMSDEGTNLVLQQIPELQELKAHPRTWDDEKTPLVKRVLRKLAQKKYIYQKNGDTLISLLTSTGPRRLPAAGTTASANFATDNYPETAGHQHKDSYADTLKDIVDFEGELRNLVGEEYSLVLLGMIDIRSYRTESILNTYLKTVRKIQEGIQRNPRKLSEKYGPTARNLEKYASLDQLLLLKKELFEEIRKYSAPGSTATASFDLESYKDKLLQSAGLDVDVARAYTEGKNGRMVGENYMPRRHFKSNAKRKAPPDKFHQMGDEVFDELVKMQAIVCKSRGRDLYSLNPNVEIIENTFLREYMRVTVHYQKILRQEGSITPLINI